MRKIALLPLIAGLLVSACTYLRPYPAPRQLVDIPLVPHENSVEIFLKNETPPDSAYYKMVGLEVFNPYASFNGLLVEMKRKAQRAGVDAVLLLDPQDTSGPADVLRGIGIKYKRNLGYVQYNLKGKDIYAYRPGGDTAMVYQARFNLLGDELANPQFGKDTTYEKYVRRYALDYLLSATRGWGFEEDESGRIIRRTKLSAAGSQELSCAYTYNKAGDVDMITLTSPMYTYNQREQKEYVKLMYNEQRQVVEKHIFGKNNARKYREVLQYDDQGRIAETIIFRNQSNQEIPVARAVYHYFTPDDLPPVSNGL